MFVSFNSLAAVAYACQKGDNSKTLLVLAEADNGEENKVIGSIDPNGNAVIESSSYNLAYQNKNAIIVENYDHTYLFELKNAAPYGDFCYPVIFADSANSCGK